MIRNLSILNPVPGVGVRALVRKSGSTILGLELIFCVRPFITKFGLKGEVARVNAEWRKFELPSAGENFCENLWALERHIHHPLEKGA